jgi:chemotaxis protein CheD
MNHFMLPTVSELDDAMMFSTRYGTYAMDVLINQLLEMGGQRKNLEAKIFGGGNVLKSFTIDKVGERNAAFVRDYLRQQRISIVAEDLLGKFPRKIYFFPEAGTVKVKKLIRLHNATIIQREQEHRQRMHQEEMAAATVDLFS